MLGLRPVPGGNEPGLRVFELPDGRHVDVFGPQFHGREHVDRGPVVGFAVRDLPAAVQGLRDAGIELLGEPGPTWQLFRGPDRNVCELVVSWGAADIMRERGFGRSVKPNLGSPGTGFRGSL